MKLSNPVVRKVHRIVIAEDNLDQVHSLAQMFKGMGHSVDFAINGYVAYDVVRRFKPDVVILDLGLPGATGYEVAAQIKKDPEFAQVRIVALTAYSDEKYRERAKQVGFDAYYVKPVNAHSLDELLGDAADPTVR